MKEVPQLEKQKFPWESNILFPELQDALKRQNYLCFLD